MTESDKALAAFATAVVAALLTAVFAFWRYIAEQRHQRRTLLNALFAELANIVEHYTYAQIELPHSVDDKFELKKRLKWSTFGALRSTNDIGKLGFLDATNIKSLLQLELLIRNDNSLLTQLADDETGRTPLQMKELRARLAARASSAAGLLTDLVAKKTELAPALERLKSELPSWPRVGA